MKVGIIGCGFVGSTAAYAMVLQGAVSEIVMVDVAPDLAQAQTDDISHAVPFSNAVQIRDGTFQDLSNARVVILACGVGQKPGEDRLQLLEKNVSIFQEVVPRVLSHAPDSVLLVATNPVDILTQMTTRISGLAPQRVIGSGTVLDTARFRTLLGEHLGVSSHSVHAYVLGEHGASEVLAWSSAMVGGIPLNDFAKQVGRRISHDVQTAIEEGVRRAADRIIKGKKATYFGIGAGLSRIVSAIRDNERAVLTVSSLAGTNEFGDVSFSLLRVVGSAGIVSTLLPNLSDGERGALHRSAQVLKEVIAGRSVQPPSGGDLKSGGK